MLRLSSSAIQNNIGTISALEHNNSRGRYLKPAVCYVLWSVTPGQSIDRPAGVKQLTVAHSLAPFAAVIGGCDDR